MQHEEAAANMGQAKRLMTQVQANKLLEQRTEIEASFYSAKPKPPQVKAAANTRQHLEMQAQVHAQVQDAVEVQEEVEDGALARALKSLRLQANLLLPFPPLLPSSLVP